MCGQAEAGPLGSRGHRQRAPAVAQVRARGGPCPASGTTERAPGAGSCPLVGPGSPCRLPPSVSALGLLTLPPHFCFAQGVTFPRCGCRKPGVVALPSPGRQSQMCLAPPSRGNSAEAVPSTGLSPLSPPLSLFTALGGSAGQARGLLTGPREGEGSALGHTACQWAPGVWGREESNSCLGRIGRVGAQAPSGCSPSPPFPQLHLPPGPPVQGSPGEHLPPAPPTAQSGFCLDPATVPPPARFPPSPPTLRPLAVATEGLAGGPGSTPQRPARSGQSQSVWQGCGFRIGWSCPRLWEEAAVREARRWLAQGHPPFLSQHPCSTFVPSASPGGGEEARGPTGRGQRSPGKRQAFWAPGVYSFSKY